MQRPGGVAQASSNWSRRCAIILVFASVLSPLPAMAVDEAHIASLPPGDDNQPEASLPTVLSVADEARYRRIFAFQDDSAWRQADQEIDRIDDKLLVGEVLGQRYTDKRYHPSYDQLARWLARYADEPDAKAIYALALLRQPT